MTIINTVQRQCSSGSVGFLRFPEYCNERKRKPIFISNSERQQTSVSVFFLIDWIRLNTISYIYFVFYAILKSIRIKKTKIKSNWQELLKYKNEITVCRQNVTYFSSAVAIMNICALYHNVRRFQNGRFSKVFGILLSNFGDHIVLILL